eukprot:6209223-Pleurochrysis_carterae.AAC.4
MSVGPALRDDARAWQLRELVAACLKKLPSERARPAKLQQLRVLRDLKARTHALLPARTHVWSDASAHVWSDASAPLAPRGQTQGRACSGLCVHAGLSWAHASLNGMHHSRAAFVFKV